MATAASRPDPSLSLFALLDPAVMADPYPLYRRMREHEPVHWDPFMNTWLVTGYSDAVTVLRTFSADRTPRPEHLERGGLGALKPISRIMAQQMLFMDPPGHTRLHRLCGAVFTQPRLAQLRAHAQAVADELIDQTFPHGRMDLVEQFAAALPAIITAGLLGVPAEDHRLLKLWSEAFGEMVGNAQHTPQRLQLLLRRLDEMTDYFRAAIQGQRHRPNDGLLAHLIQAGSEAEGAQVTEDELVAMALLFLVGGQKTTTNLIATGLLALLQDPVALTRMRDDPSVLGTGIEELLRYVSPTQHTARIAPGDHVLGGKPIRQGDAVTVVLAAANRDPARFVDPDRLDLARADNRHLAFGWSTHFCLGAPLARLEGRIALATLLRRLPGLALADSPLQWRDILILRGLTALDVTWERPS